MHNGRTAALALILVFSLAACGGNDTPVPPGGGNAPDDHGTSRQTSSASPQTVQKPSGGGDASDHGTSEQTASGSQQTEREPSGGEMNGWLGTKIGRFYSQFADGQMHLEYEAEQEGMVVTFFSAVRVDKTCLSTQIDGQSVTVLLMDSEYMYPIDHNRGWTQC